MTSVTALKFPFAPGPLELAKSVNLINKFLQFLCFSFLYLAQLWCSEAQDTYSNLAYVNQTATKLNSGLTQREQAVSERYGS